MVSFLNGIDATSSALNAERIRMDVVSQNISMANVSHGLDGKPYQRQQVVFDTFLQQATGGLNGSQAQPVAVARVESDKRPPRLVFSPSHPDADSEGMVALPDINVANEMADLIVSSRSFEANLAVVKNARNMAQQSLAIGRR